MDGAAQSLAARLLHLYQHRTIIGQPVVEYASGAPCMVGKFAYGGAQRAKAADGVLGSWKRKDNVERVQVFVDTQGWCLVVCSPEVVAISGLFSRWRWGAFLFLLNPQCAPARRYIILAHGSLVYISLIWPK